MYYGIQMIQIGDSVILAVRIKDEFAVEFAP